MGKIALITGISGQDGSYLAELLIKKKYKVYGICSPYKKDKNNRNKIARNGRKFYFKYFNSTLVAEFIINKTLDLKSSQSFIWEK